LHSSAILRRPFVYTLLFVAGCIATIDLWLRRTLVRIVLYAAILYIFATL
jgi:hypothetical protein